MGKSKYTGGNLGDNREMDAGNYIFFLYSMHLSGLIYIGQDICSYASL